MKNCNKCGKPVEDNLMFCGNCGTKVQPQQQQRFQQQQPQQQQPQQQQSQQQPTATTNNEIENWYCVIVCAVGFLIAWFLNYIFGFCIVGFICYKSCFLFFDIIMTGVCVVSGLFRAYTDFS